MSSNRNGDLTGSDSSDSIFTARQGATRNADQQTASSTARSEERPWTSDSQLNSQSQNNLRQASVALDAAYERITQLRNNINSLLNRMPSEVSGTTTGSTSTSQARSGRSPEPSIGPAHSALVLSGGEGEEVVEQLNRRAARLRSLIPPSARQRLEDFESNSGSGGNTSSVFNWDRFSQGDHPRAERADMPQAPVVPPRPRTPPMPDLVIPRALNFVETQAALRRQSANRDDSSTMIGRRVAARVHASTSEGQNSGTRPSLSQLEQRLQNQTAVIARELENMTDRLVSRRSRRVELAVSSWRGRGGNTRREVRRDLGDDADAGSTPSAVHRPPAAWPLPSPPDFSGNATLSPLLPVSDSPSIPLARETVLVDNTVQFAPQAISRRSSEDNAPLEERVILPTGFRPLIQSSYGQQVPGPTRDTPRDLANMPGVRGTLLNLLSRDRVDQSVSSYQPGSGRPVTSGNNEREPASLESNLPPQAGQTRRRRGWTRLNADGDEIESDDEESANTRRLRMRLAYGTPSTDQAAARFNTIEDILWRTSGSFGSDSEDLLTPEATDNTDSCNFAQSPPVCSYSSHPNPLPTPVEEMLVYPTTKQQKHTSRIISVSKHASLAGR
ncbi:hypothetical protein HYDPIDRAFT_25025 [Hydnomerulius pinastri MD-312]|nr:hypothetical protein HYDPIDRAFT_25025 [Hydnomerulius pinastri MD-312]